MSKCPCHLQSSDLCSLTLCFSLPSVRYVEAAKDQQSLVLGLQEEAEEINSQEELAGLSMTSYKNINLIKRQISPYAELWKLVKTFKEKYQTWMFGPVFAFNLEELESLVPAWTKLSVRLAKDLQGPALAVAQKYATFLVDFEGNCNLIRALRTPGMRQRHWKRIHAEIPMLKTVDKNQLTLHGMLQAGLQKHVALLRELADLAARELVIEQAINMIRTSFMDFGLTFSLDKECGFDDVHTLTNANDLLMFIDDSQLRIKGLSTSVYVDPHKDVVVQWDDAMTNVRSILESWLEVQGKWSHLGPLFGPHGLSGQLTVESKRFTEITRQWKSTVDQARDHGKLSELLRHTDLPSRLEDLSKALEAVVKGVMEFLDEKRSIFPRFYFLSNNEMVDVLVRSHQPVTVEPFLIRCFPGIKKIKLAPLLTNNPSGSSPQPSTLSDLSHEGQVREGRQIQTLVSPELELLPLRNRVDLFVPDTDIPLDVEVWMTELEKGMKVSMKASLLGCLDAYYSRPPDQWMLSWPAQSLLLSSAITWCKDVTDILHDASLTNAGTPPSLQFEKLEVKSSAQIHRIVDMVLQKRLSPLQHGCIENFIIAEVYRKDVTRRLQQECVSSIDDIEWLRVPRFYLEKGDNVTVKCGYSQLGYGDEYLGSSLRLVITPLTERAFSSLITSVHLHFGGAPEGPAGTGKSETVKELAKQVAKQCIVL